MTLCFPGVCMMKGFPFACDKTVQYNTYSHILAKKADFFFFDMRKMGGGF